MRKLSVMMLFDMGLDLFGYLLRYLVLIEGRRKHSCIPVDVGQMRVNEAERAALKTVL